MTVRPAQVLFYWPMGAATDRRIAGLLGARQLTGSGSPWASRTRPERQNRVAANETNPNPGGRRHDERNCFTSYGPSGSGASLGLPLLLLPARATDATRSAGGWREVCDPELLLASASSQTPHMGRNWAAPGVIALGWLGAVLALAGPDMGTTSRSGLSRADPDRRRTSIDPLDARFGRYGAELDSREPATNSRICLTNRKGPWVW